MSNVLTTQQDLDVCSHFKLTSDNRDNTLDYIFTSGPVATNTVLLGGCPSIYIDLGYYPLFSILGKISNFTIVVIMLSYLFKI